MRAKMAWQIYSTVDLACRLGRLASCSEHSYAKYKRLRDEQTNPPPVIRSFQLSKKKILTQEQQGRIKTLDELSSSAGNISGVLATTRSQEISLKRERSKGEIVGC